MKSGIFTTDGLQRGPPDSSYAGGEYYGVLLFPAEYPFKPPGIKVGVFVHFAVMPDLQIASSKMYTPSGRFQPDKKICFSMSDFHPGTVSLFYIHHQLALSY